MNFDGFPDAMLTCADQAVSTRDLVSLIKIRLILLKRKNKTVFWRAKRINAVHPVESNPTAKRASTAKKTPPLYAGVELKKYRDRVIASES